MKKIFAILISLLFIASVFGVAQTMADVECDCEENYYKFSKTTVHVGETFTASIWGLCIFVPDKGILIVEDFEAWDNWDGTFPLSLGAVELIDLNYVDEEGNVLSEDNPPEGPCDFWIQGTYKAISPGTLNMKRYTGEDEYTVTATVTVIPKSYPMQQFMKILGIGKEK
ncbi:MAG TPA: hypothetical protein PLI06_01140 [Methanofastidiosum sp.]|nr:hypothetical protein [Methanofastidiosum sp.]